ncbi:unnamed protein product [Effrenium voratum]|uniref:Uncharacterized protein n=1 Tax=Effrenium voratum TaxID=2562239 RepID=A0AA36J3Y3_9DINO|nr:unnamed protein product [Effrenium voratum]
MGGTDLRERCRFRCLRWLCLGLLLGLFSAFAMPGAAPRARARVALQAKRLVRCPSCGQAQRADCDGKGRLLGGVAQVFEGAPVKAYSVCPRFRGRYQRKGRKFDSLFDPDIENKERSRMLEVPATWRSLTKIRIRELPDIGAKVTGESVGPYESFVVEDVIRKGDQHFLKLAGKAGWVFDRGVVGQWNGKPICERLNS